MTAALFTFADPSFLLLLSGLVIVGGFWACVLIWEGFSDEEEP